MSKWSDSTIIKGADGVTERPVAVNADGEILIGASGVKRTDTVLLEQILTELRINNQYLFKIVGSSNEVLESDAEVKG